MQRVERLLRSVDRAQQCSRWLGFPFAVMRKFRDDNGGALTTVVAYNAFFALFPLLLVVVTVLGSLLGRDSGFQQCLLGSAVAEFPIIGYPGAGQPPRAARQRRRLGGWVGGRCVGHPRPGPGHPARDGRDLEHPEQGSDPASWPGRSGVCCCWWSSPFGWPRRACWNGCAVRRLVLVLAVGWGRAVGSVGPVLVRRAGWLTRGCRG
jgi:hypothetical protein